MASGQLDEISAAIGRLEGLLEGVNQYIHENKHEVANVSQKLEALGAKITGDMAAVEERMRVRFELAETRLSRLEQLRSKDDGVRSVWIEILKSPIVAGAIGGLLALLAMTLAFFKGVHPQ